MTPRSKPALLSIIAHARSGALDHAWALFTSHGFDRVEDDAAVLSVRGRLLKDRAQAATGDERRALYQEAARAYGIAGALGEGATYPLINAATLSLLAGQSEASRELAALALALIDTGRDGPETPYYREATRAEALLLLGRMDEARASLAAAVASAPRAWEDHASTLRQFALVLEARGEDKAWLDACRPPRCLHFAGHMAVAEDEAAGLADRLGQIVRDERIGFAWGALAAGSDILIAEALLAHGVELHVVLPGEPAAFRRASVEPAGGRWAERFDALMDAADTVRVVAAGSSATPGIQIAAEVSMGCTVMHARTFATEAVQLLVLEDEAAVGGAPGGTVWAGELWRETGRRQLVATAGRSGRAAAPDLRGAGDGRAVAAAMLAIRIGEARDPARVLAEVGAALGEAGDPLAKPQWAGGVLAAAYATPSAAARAALAAAAALKGSDARIAAHYGAAERVDNPFGPGSLLLGPAAALPARMLDSAPPGAVHLSGDFAAALNAAAGPGRTEYVGDLPGEDVEQPVGLYALRP